MSRKSNKTSHVLNLITNRTGISTEELEHNTSPSTEQFFPGFPVAATPERAISAPSEKAAPAPIEKIAPLPAKRRLNVTEISGDIAEAVSSQIRSSLEIVEIQESKARAKILEDAAKARENAKQARMEEISEMSIEKLNKEVKPAVAAVRREQPQIETYAPENFDESAHAVTDEPPVAPAPQAQPTPQAQTPPAAQPVPASPPQSEKPPKPAVEEPPKERLYFSTQKTMDGLVLVNILEEVMRLEAPKIMQSLDMCCCERCLSDVLAIALNSIPPKYVVTPRGALFAKISSYGTQYQTDIFAHLTKACVAVSKSPSHP